MFDYLVKRVATIVPTLVLVSMLIFGLQQLLPGDPAKILAGEEQDPTVVAHLREKLHLDEPLPMDLTTNGHQSALAKWIGRTPRSLVRSYARKDGIDYTGTPDHVAGMMQEIMEEVGGDGFLIFNSYFDRRYVIEICDGLVPELQRRGVTRKAYTHKHLKDNLLEF